MVLSVSPSWEKTAAKRASSSWLLPSAIARARAVTAVTVAPAARPPCAVFLLAIFLRLLPYPLPVYAHKPILLSVLTRCERLARQEKKRAALEEKQKSIQDELDRMK